MQSLRCINFQRTGIKELTSSIGNLPRLTKLNLEACKNLMNLPSTIHVLQDLKILILEDCEKLEEILELPPDIEVVNASHWKDFQKYQKDLTAIHVTCQGLFTLTCPDAINCSRIWRMMWKSFYLLRYISLSLTYVFVCALICSLYC
jgi:hypothetical protein